MNSRLGWSDYVRFVLVVLVSVALFGLILPCMVSAESNELVGGAVLLGLLYFPFVWWVAKPTVKKFLDKE